MRSLYFTLGRLPAGRETRHCGHRRRAKSGFTLAEVMIAVAVLGFTLFGVMQGFSFMELRNRESSQRMLAASIETEILELFKALPYTAIGNSTASVPVYLKEVPGGAPDARWIVPAVNAWQAVPVEDVNPGSAAAPASSGAPGHAQHERVSALDREALQAALEDLVDCRRLLASALEQAD